MLVGIDTNIFLYTTKFILRKIIRSIQQHSVIRNKNKVTKRRVTGFVDQY